MNSNDFKNFFKLIKELLTDWNGITTDFKEKTLKSIIESVFIPDISDADWITKARDNDSKFILG